MSDLLGRAARSIRNDWERETWDRRSRLYNVAVSDLLLAVALNDREAIERAAEMVARAHLREPAAPVQLGAS